MSLLSKAFLFILLLIPPAFAVDDQVDIILDNTPASTQRTNDNFRLTSRRISALENAIPASIITGILSTSHGGLGADASAWTSGDLIYLSSTGVIGHASVSSLTSSSQLFTSSGTFVAPTGKTTVYLTMVGGGGAGGGSVGGSNSGGGGGGGAYIIQYPYTVIPGNSYTVTVGDGGTGVSGADGNAGGTTSFDGTISVLGGSGGLSAGNNGGAGGVGTGFNSSATVATAGIVGGGYSFSGGNGAKNGAGNNSGAGGGTPFGTGAAGRTTQGVGIAGTANTGVGGGGASGPSDPGGTNRPGGQGGSGFVLVQY